MPFMLPVAVVTVQVTVCAGLLVPVTVAVNCCVPFLGTVAVEGLTVTELTVVVPLGGLSEFGCGTVTAAVPLLDVLTVEVALIIKVVGF